LKSAACRAFEGLQSITGRGRNSLRNKKTLASILTLRKHFLVVSLWNTVKKIRAMLIWILIVGGWVGIQLLILHDATETEGSSPVSAGLRYVGLLALRSLKAAFIPKIRRAVRIGRSSKKVSVDPSAPNDQEVIPPSSSQPAPEALTTPERRPSKASKSKWWSKDRRAPISSADLELAIADAVRKASPECEDFVGVIVHHRGRKIHLEPDWTVRGVRFGKADRKRAEVALAVVVDKLQQEFRLADSQP
jgi:hypothetical protein